MVGVDWWCVKQRQLFEFRLARALDEIQTQWQVNAIGVHRIGQLAIGDLAVWVGVSAPHRDAAFQAARQIIDRIKAEVPIWKQEYYVETHSLPQWLANAEAKQ